MLSTADAPVVVTGAAGYLGGRLAGVLGHRARSLVRAPVAWLPARQQVPCDLLGPVDDLAAALAGAAAVVHLAGHNEVVAAAEPARARDETVAMAEAVRDAARAAGVARVVYVSTIHVYGDHLAPGAHVTEDVPAAPRSAYAEARWACEEALRAGGDLDVVVLRLSNAVGAPADPTVDRWTLVASDLCRTAVLDGRVVLRSSGMQWRDFIALEDAARLVARCVDPAVPAGTYNLASGRSSTVRSLAELVQDRVALRTGTRPALEAPPVTGGPDPAYTLDVRALAAHGLRAERTLEEAVDEIVDHCLKHESVLR